VGLSFAFVSLFNRIGWLPHGGLALANSLATAIETTTLIILMRKRLKTIQGRELIKGSGAAVLGTLGMSAVIVLWLQVMPNGSAVITTLGGVALGALTYGLVLMLLRIPEIRSLFQWIKRRLSNINPPA
jgi:putative peptidoglycan lipid II flippase